MAISVRISLNKKLLKILEILQQEYPTLEDAEIFKLALSNLFQSKIKSKTNLSTKTNTFFKKYKEIDFGNPKSTQTTTNQDIYSNYYEKYAK
jgi:hypothetical protein